MEPIITLDEQNIDSEHICCAITDKKCSDGYEAKKQWLKNQFKEGYTFKKLDVRGKVFIEYVPAENAWAPLEAPGYMMINCFWVSGQFKGKGNGKRLLQECIQDSQQMNGIVAISSTKKQPFLSDPKFYKKQGFTVCDTAEPYFELYCLKFNDDAPDPAFRECAKEGICDRNEGITVYYTNGCPFTDYYVADLERVATGKGFKFSSVQIRSKDQAQNHFVPYTNYSVFLDGRFLTQHILNEKYFDKFITP
jgi:ribosomal protein S18 acetylase RimI-like enzyme